jgi:hypothetical protein
MKESLIKHDDRHALPADKPETDEADEEDESTKGSRHWIGPALPPDQAAGSPDIVSVPQHQPEHDHRTATEHHSKVIEPLEPIVPRSEEIKREIARLNEEETRAGKKNTTEKKKHKDAPVEAAPVVAAEPTPPLASEPEPQPAPPPPAPMPEPDVALPEPESLAATDVAQARALAEAAAKAEADAAAAQAARDAAAAQAAPQAPAETAPEAPAAPAKPAEEEAPKHSSRRQRRRLREEDEARAEDEAKKVKPEKSAPAGDEEALPLTGKLIMPSANRPAPEALEAHTPSAMPPKLAPGEVFVDEAGNVIVGE